MTLTQTIANNYTLGGLRALVIELGFHPDDFTQKVTPFATELILMAGRHGVLLTLFEKLSFDANEWLWLEIAHKFNTSKAIYDFADQLSVPSHKLKFTAHKTDNFDVIVKQAKAIQQDFDDDEGLLQWLLA